MTLDGIIAPCSFALCKSSWGDTQVLGVNFILHV